MSRSLNRLSRGSYRFARGTRNINAVMRAARTGSMRPIWVRLVNRLIGRLVGRMWLR